MESIGRLAGGGAHDLNNLLSPILGYSELLSEGFDARDSRKIYVDQILHAGLRARDLVHQLLAFSRKQALEYQNINLNDVILRFEKLLRRTIREDVDIKMTLFPGLGNVWADIGQIEQVLMNLAVNAQDAMPGGGTLHIETDQVLLDDQDKGFHRGVPPGEYIRLLISDTGCGMVRETQDQIFEPFFSTKGEQGTGLGLATVYGIVKQHDGGIWVYSEISKGTTFKIYLPLYCEECVQKGNQEEYEAPPTVNATILLVEDNDQVRDLAYEILQRQKYHIITAKNGMDALEILKNRELSIDLLLTDVIMPEMNGKELYEYATEVLPNLKVIFMSGYTDDTISLHGLAVSGAWFIQKPFTIRSLTTKVHESLTT